MQTRSVVFLDYEEERLSDGFAAARLGCSRKGPFLLIGGKCHVIEIVKICAAKPVPKGNGSACNLWENPQKCTDEQEKDHRSA